MYQFPGSPYGGPPPGYGSFPPGQMPPPGMSAAPGMVAPGTEMPPGMAQQQQQQQQHQQQQTQQQAPAGFPANFQIPGGMPNINFSAPVIRLGTSAPSRGGQGDSKDTRNRAGLGSSLESSRQQQTNNMAVLIPPTKDEISRTIFIGGITEGVGGDDGMEKLLSSVGNLKKWIRATDSDGKNCRFGFAEYEDPDSLATAIEVLKGVQVPVKLQSVKKEDETQETDIEKSPLLVLADDGTMDYLEEYNASKEDRDPIQGQLREDAAKSALAAALSELEHPTAPIQQSDMSRVDVNGGANGEVNGDGEVVTIPLSIDDELADIPAEMRAIVAQEITSFRERSNRRDLERLKREEEIEARERQRDAPRVNRLATPPPVSTPTGPNGSIPSGPRDRSIANAPSGPKGYQGAQIPRDYQKGVSFVNGAEDWLNREDEDSEASDEELERRRKAKKEAEQEKLYLDQERRWLNRERSRAAAIEREQARDKDEDGKRGAEKEAAARKFREWDDTAEIKRGVEEYYADHSLWIRNRAAFRAREANLDDIDRAAEDRERAKDEQQQNHARGLADDFLNRQAAELDSRGPLTAPREPQRFKLSLGAATQRQQAAAATNKRTMAEVEGLLEDEEEAETTTKRTLVPIKFDSAAEASGLSEEERQQAARQLAAEIPSDKDGLWAWDVKWDFVDDSVLTEQLKPFVEKKIVEYLGVQEQMLVEVVESHIRDKGKPQDLVEQLEGALDEEAEVLVKKLWRMLIFFSESEKRGISG